jgi:hypothetical protein
MGDESGDVTAIKLPVRNERQCRRLLVLGFLSEPAHSGMQPALPIPVETLAPPFDLVTGNWRLGNGKKKNLASLHNHCFTKTIIFQ